MNKLIWLTLAVMAVIAGCNSTTTTPPDENKADYEFSTLSKEYLYFLPGSYWMYQDDSTQQQYKVELFSSHEELRYDGGGANVKEYSYRAYWMYFSGNGAGLQKTEMFASNFTVSDDIPNSAERVYFDNGHYKIAFAPFYPIGSEILLGGEEGIFVNKEFLPSMTVNGKVYNNVYHAISKEIKESRADTVYYHFYYAKNHGLIKWNIVDGNTGKSYSLLSDSLKQ